MGGSNQRGIGQASQNNHARSTCVEPVLFEVLHLLPRLVRATLGASPYEPLCVDSQRGGAAAR